MSLNSGVHVTTLCDKICQWLSAGRWFSPGTPVSSTNKADCHVKNIAEILLKVVLSIIILTVNNNPQIINFLPYIIHIVVVIYHPLLRTCMQFIFLNSYVTLELTVCIQTFVQGLRLPGTKVLSQRIVSYCISKVYFGRYQHLAKKYSVACVQIASDSTIFSIMLETVSRVWYVLYFSFYFS